MNIENNHWAKAHKNKFYNNPAFKGGVTLIALYAGFSPNRNNPLVNEN